MQSQKKFAKNVNYRRTHFGVQHLMKKLFPFIFLIFYFQETKTWKEKGDHLKLRISGLLFSSVSRSKMAKMSEMTEKCGNNEKIRGQKSSGRNDKTPRHSFLYANWTSWYGSFQKQKNNFPKTYFSWVKCVRR